MTQRVFVDTSALYALLDEDDGNHGRAALWLSTTAAEPSLILLTHAYITVETAALVHRRLGTDAVRQLFVGLLPAVTTGVVDEALHRRAGVAYAAGLSRRTSFVDQVSFEFMRDAHLDTAFAFDADFETEGFTLVPS